MVDNLIIPIIHSNGTSRRMLNDQWSGAYASLQEAYGKLQESSPHMRDFYIQTDGQKVYNKACEQHMARLQKVQDVMDELEALSIGVYAQDA